MSEAQKPDGGSIKHDISVPVATCPTSSRRRTPRCEADPGPRPVPFGHLGDGNIHYNVSQPVGADTAEFLDRWHDVNKVVFDVVAEASAARSRPSTASA